VETDIPGVNVSAKAEITADGGPTEAEVAADRQLAIEVTTASLTGLASLVNVYAGAA
jgi:hypothetical protein